VIGLLNIGVAFGMAMFVALRARKLTQQQREIIYYALARRFRDRPLSFLRPKKETPTSG
jgi:site-specific recombinase